MPTYEYECTDCGHRFEEFQRMSDPHIETCPECSGSVNRLVSVGGGVIFKGSGFHATDYARPACKGCPREAGCPNSGASD